MIVKILLSVALLLLSSCSCKKQVAEKEEKVKLINVLDKELFDDCHIKGSYHVPFMDFDNPDSSPIEEFVKNLPKHTKMVIYCSNYLCSASGEIASKLNKMGFENVWAYEAGMAEWYQKGLPVSGACKQGYLFKQMNPPAEHRGDFKVIETNELKVMLGI